MTDVELETGSASQTAPSRRPRASLDLYLNIALAALLVLVIGGGAYFAYSVYRDQQTSFESSASGRIVTALSAQVRKSPNDPVLRVRLGEAYGAMGRYPQAIEQLNAALKINPTHQGAYLDLGMIAQLNKDDAAAERYFQKVIALSDSTQYEGINNAREQALFNLGTLMLSQKRYAEAAGFFKGALVIRRDASDTYYRLAKAYQGLGDTDAAITQLETGLQFDPGFAEAHYLLAELYKSKKDDVNASYQFMKAAELAPTADQPRQAVEAYGPASDWVAKAKTALAADNVEEALTDVLVARNLDPKSLAAVKLHGQVLIQRKELASALDVYNQAAKLDPKDAEVQQQITVLKPQVAALAPAKAAAAKKKAKAGK